MKFFFLSNFPLNWLTKPNASSFIKRRSFQIIRCFFTDLGALKQRPTVPCNIFWGLYAYLMSGWMEFDQIWHAASFTDKQMTDKNSDQSIQPFLINLPQKYWKNASKFWIRRRAPPGDEYFYFCVFRIIYNAPNFLFSYISLYLEIIYRSWWLWIISL